jgi:hypothetical protein
MQSFLRLAWWIKFVWFSVILLYSRLFPKTAMDTEKFANCMQERGPLWDFSKVHYATEMFQKTRLKWDRNSIWQVSNNSDTEFAAIFKWQNSMVLCFKVILQGNKYKSFSAITCYESNRRTEILFERVSNLLLGLLSYAVSQLRVHCILMKSSSLKSSSRSLSVSMTMLWRRHMHFMILTTLSEWIPISQFSWKYPEGTFKSSAFSGQSVVEYSFFSIQHLPRIQFHQELPWWVCCIAQNIWKLLVNSWKTIFRLN